MHKIYFNKYFNHTHKPKFSIVMAYFNRKEQIKNTLTRINNTYKNNLEVIIVDDNSKDEEKLFDIIDNFNYGIVYRIITREEKCNFINPCIVYNCGFALTKGEIIVIQNPECIHFTNILEEFEKLDFENTYYTIPVITSRDFQQNYQILLLMNQNISKENLIEYIEENNGPYTWLNHWIMRNTNYHFCSAISKKNLDKLEGFDENYGYNLWYDDDDLVYRIGNLLKIEQLKNHLAIHLYHLNSSIDSGYDEKKVEINKNRFHKMKEENSKKISWNIDNSISIYKSGNYSR